MIRCKPRSIFSWNFQLDGEGHTASTEINWLTEQGVISADGAKFNIQKHGVFSGQWTMSTKEQEFATAKKSSALRRAFELSSPMGDLKLVPDSLFTRGFRIEFQGELLARIKPVKFFTRSARIELLNRDLDFPTVCFAFWLVLISWRRAASKNS